MDDWLRSTSEPAGHFEVVPAAGRFLLLRNGEPVVDPYGQQKLYGSREEAEFTAATWELRWDALEAEVRAVYGEAADIDALTRLRRL